MTKFLGNISDNWIMENNHKKIVLLVEDQASLARLLGNVISQAGFAVIHASNGKEALEEAEKTLPDVVVSDWEMPVMDGLELTCAWRANPKTSEIPLIILTSKEDSKSILMGIRAGADDFLSKKIAMDVLQVKIEAFIKLQKLKKESKDRHRLEAMKELVVTYNHQFNNPLTILYGQVALMMRTAQPEQLSKLEKIQDQLRRIKNLVESISRTIKTNSTEEIESEEYSDSTRMLKVR